MGVLHDLLTRRLVENGDELYFTFRQNRFACKIVLPGQLSQCTWETPDGKAHTAFSQGHHYKSLTAWADACLHELLEEYVSRFSAYKRVRHSPTDLPVENLRKRLHCLEAPPDVQELKNALLKEKQRSAQLLRLLRISQTHMLSNDVESRGIKRSATVLAAANKCIVRNITCRATASPTPPEQ